MGARPGVFTHPVRTWRRVERAVLLVVGVLDVGKRHHIKTPPEPTFRGRYKTAWRAGQWVLVLSPVCCHIRLLQISFCCHLHSVLDIEPQLPRRSEVGVTFETVRGSQESHWQSHSASKHCMAHRIDDLGRDA